MRWVRGLGGLGEVKGLWIRREDWVTCKGIWDGFSGEGWHRMVRW